MEGKPWVDVFGVSLTSLNPAEDVYKMITRQAPLHSSASLICGFSERTPKTLSAHISKYNAALMFLTLNGKAVRLGTKNIQKYTSVRNDLTSLQKRGMEIQLGSSKIVSLGEKIGGESSLIFTDLL